MNGPSPSKTSVRRRKTAPLFWLLGLQTFCAVLLFADAAVELSGMAYLLEGLGHEYLEFAIVLALALGIGLTLREIRKVLRRTRPWKTA